MENLALNPTETAAVESIPAQVFLNHFFALSFHFRHAPEGHELSRMPAFHRVATADLSATEQERLRQHLLDCWSAEYTLRTTAELGDETYLRHAIHWTFPQAYYSVMAGARASLCATGTATSHPEAVQRALGRRVVKQFYPGAAGFYAAGNALESRVYRLPLAQPVEALRQVSTATDAQSHIAQFLRTTRKRRAWAVRRRVQSHPQTALRSVQSGEVLRRFRYEHWDQLTWLIGYTTIFDLLARLEISNRQREIRRYVAADIDFALFHRSLLKIVEYLNFIHEAYVAKAVGPNRYDDLWRQAPSHLRGGFLQDRWEERLSPLFGPVLERKSA